MLTYIDNSGNTVPLKDGDSVYIGLGRPDEGLCPGIIYKVLHGPVLAPVSLGNGKYAILQDESFFGHDMTVNKITKEENIIPA